MERKDVDPFMVYCAGRRQYEGPPAKPRLRASLRQKAKTKDPSSRRVPKSDLRGDSNRRAQRRYRFRMRPGMGWMPAEAWQHDSTIAVARVFVLRVRLAGVLPMPRKKCRQDPKPPPRAV